MKRLRRNRKEGRRKKKKKKKKEMKLVRKGGRRIRQVKLLLCLAEAGRKISMDRRSIISRAGGDVNKMRISCKNDCTYLLLHTSSYSCYGAINIELLLGSSDEVGPTTVGHLVNGAGDYFLHESI